MCWPTNDTFPAKNTCDYCHISYDGNTYVYHIDGYGKHCGKVICSHCMMLKMEEKLLKKLKQEEQEKQEKQEKKMTRSYNYYR
tara:strand:+ start:254 stop:502 length:249 start_codon:yes stop_codon:yes gene_type:complete